MPDAPVVVALTASAFEEDRQQVLEAGCDDFVRKPAREEDIFAAMERHLGLRYIYERPGAAEAESVVIDDAVLAGLPSEWREAMRTAATEADEDRIAELIQQVVESHPTVAEGLASMTRDYRYDEMIGLLGEAP